jgi:hypothetical protein
MSYNGHKNWNHWNVALWLFNDENLYFNVVKHHVRRAPTKDDAAHRIFCHLRSDALSSIGVPYSERRNLSASFLRKLCATPDGAPYTVTAIRAALVGDI